MTRLIRFSSKGTIPPEAQVAEIKKKEREAAEGEKKEDKSEGMDSDDEEVDQSALRNGELEG